MNRKKIIAGNWKMNKSLQEAQTLVNMILNQVNDFDNVTKIILPPFPYLDAIQKLIIKKANITIGAQNCHTNTSGAFTGEISATMLASVGCEYVLVGHSERRQYFNEQDADFVLKIKEALSNTIIPIYCVGETLRERKANNQFNIVAQQLQVVLSQFKTEEICKFVIAYEPVWAIGTGETATTQQAQEMHSFIRKTLSELCDDATASNISILYGGSCNAQNAQELFKCPDVDGGLIGGASLNADDFCKIIFSF